MQFKKYTNKILLVDDDVKNLQVAMNILKDYNVLYAQSGKKALELASNNNFDLILLDIVMPILDGYDTCKILKKNELTRNIPIIFLTVKDEEKDIVKGFNEGAVDYITKPFLATVLLKRVQLHLKLSSTMKDLKNINNNLNELVKKQVEEIREKEQILYQQSKIIAMSEIIDVISLQWKHPLDMIKLYLQSLKINIIDVEVKNTLDRTLRETIKLDAIMYDFQKFFNKDIEKTDVNLKVLIDSVIFLLKDQLIKEHIDFDIKGNHLINLYTCNEELQHVFIKLLTYSIDNFLISNSGKKHISIEIKSDKNSIYILYKDNSQNISEHKLKDLLNFNETLENSSFDLGFYIMKVFIEKNGGLLDCHATKRGITLSIKFDKGSSINK